MAKDRLRYRDARKHALGSEAVEQSIGITQLISAASVSPLQGGTESALADRPVGLMKWSFDDTIVEEMLPVGLTFSSTLAAAAPSTAVDEAPPREATIDTAQRVPDPAACSLLVRVVSEGVPDTVIEGVLRSRFAKIRRASVHFLTPIDVACCASRYVWVRGVDAQTALACLEQVATPRRTTAVMIRAGENAAGKAELVRTPSGELWLGPAQVIAVPYDAPFFPLAMLPSLRYTVAMRNIPGSLNSLLPRLTSLRDKGFLNYGHMARHGLGSLRAYEQGKALLHRDYVGFLTQYVKGLTEGTPNVLRELPALLEALSNPKASRQDWQHVTKGIEMGVRQDKDAIPRWEQTGLFAPHHAMLSDFVRRAADVAPRHHDSAQVIREAIPRRVLQEKLRVVSEVHFNAQASLRWNGMNAVSKQHPSACVPDRVQVGDVVLLPNDDRHNANKDDPFSRAFSLADVYEGMADHMHTSMVSAAHRDWVYLAQDTLERARDEALASGRLRVVASQSEADTYTVDQVVLPLYGRGIASLPCFLRHTSGSDSHIQTLGQASDMCHALARELDMEGLSQMRTAPLASYRHLVQKPKRFAAYVCDEHRGWDWEIGSAEGPTQPGQGAEEATGMSLKASLYKDQEGVTRVRSPLMVLNGKNLIARRGIRGSRGGGAGSSRGPRHPSYPPTPHDADLARHHFLKPARKPGMMCVVQMELPRGSPITSALREVFQFTTLSPSAIFHLLSRR